MYRVTTSVDVDFAHVVAGHDGACRNIHGHTWKLEVCLGAEVLDNTGFVADFKRVKVLVLKPVAALLDHSFACGQETLRRLLTPLQDAFEQLNVDGLRRGEDVVCQNGLVPHPGLQGAFNDGMEFGGKVAVFPFNPTSERLAEWLYRVVVAELSAHLAGDVANRGLCCCWVRVYETLHPVAQYAEFSPQ